MKTNTSGPLATTISLTSKRQCTFPKSFVDAAGLTPGTQLRATQIGNGLYITPIPEPTEAEFRAVLKLAGTLNAPRQTQKDEADVFRVINKIRAKRKIKSRP